MAKRSGSVVRVEMPRAYSQPQHAAPIIIRQNTGARLAGLKARGRAYLQRRRAAVGGRKDMMMGAALAGGVAGFVEKLGMDLPKLDILGVEGTYGVAAAFFAPNTPFWNGTVCALLGIGAKTVVTSQL